MPKNYWVIKADEVWNERFARFPKKGKRGRWWGRRLPRDWKRGDRLFVWASGANPRLIGRATLLRPHDGSEDGLEHFAVRYDSNLLRVQPDIPKLKSHPTLAQAQFFLPGRQGTVHRLQRGEGIALERFVDSLQDTSLPGFRPSRDRHSSARAREAFERWWPDPNVRRHCIALLRDTIDAARSCGTRAWTVTLFSDYMRVNVGQVEVLTAEASAIRYLVADSATMRLSKEWKERLGRRLLDGSPRRIRASYYKAVPGSSAVLQFEPADAGAVPASATKHHHEFIARAAKAKSVTPHRRSHSPGVVRALRPKTTARRRTARAALMIGVYRYGDPPKRGEGLRIGVSRYLPRGVPKATLKRRRYFDVWLPVLAPSARLLKSQRGNFRSFLVRYRRELLSRAASRQALKLVAEIALRMPVMIGGSHERYVTHLVKWIRSARSMAV